MKLSDPFPPDKVKQKPGPGGRKLDFVSHALVTERLNEVDPEWESEVLTEHIYKDGQGRLHCEGVTIRLTVHINGKAVSRVESGGPQRQDGFANEIKNANSDALKRAAMRFGVALGMWDSLVDSENDEDYQAEHLVPVPTRTDAPVTATRPSTAREPAPALQALEAWITPNQLTQIKDLTKALGAEKTIGEHLTSRFGASESTELTREQAAMLITDMRKSLAERQKELVAAGSAGVDQYTR